MEGGIYWNWTVAVYLFIAGVSAGAFIISAAGYFLDKIKYARIVRIGAYIAPFPVIAGTLCLIYDLERPYLFWKLLFSFQPTSVMWLGTWLLILFFILSFAHFYICLPEKYDVVTVIQRMQNRYRRIKIFRSLASNSVVLLLRQENLAKRQNLIAGLGSVMAVGVGIYTGILLGALSARPFWNSPVLPMLFLLSALKAGTASVSLSGHLFHGFRGMRDGEIRSSTSLIRSIDFIVMILFVITLFLYIFGFYVSTKSSLEAVRLIMGGHYTLLF